MHQQINLNRLNKKGKTSAYVTDASTGTAIFNLTRFRAQPVLLRSEGAWGCPMPPGHTVKPRGRAKAPLHHEYQHTFSHCFDSMLGARLFTGRYIRGAWDQFNLTDPTMGAGYGVYSPKTGKRRGFLKEMLGSFVTKGRKIDVGQLKIDVLR